MDRNFETGNKKLPFGETPEVIKLVSASPIIDSQRPETLSWGDLSRRDQAHLIACSASVLSLALGLTALIVGETLHIPEIRTVAFPVTVTGLAGTVVTFMSSLAG